MTVDLPSDGTGHPAEDGARDGAAPSEVGEDRAVVDRVVDGQTAVLLVGPTGTEAHLPVEQLPDGATDGTWLVLDLATEPLTVLRIDEHLTRARFDVLTTRLDRIRRSRSSGRFRR